jgi:hypothetical protein
LIKQLHTNSPHNLNTRLAGHTHTPQRLRCMPRKCGRPSSLTSANESSEFRPRPRPESMAVAATSEGGAGTPHVPPTTTDCPSGIALDTPPAAPTLTKLRRRLPTSTSTTSTGTPGAIIASIARITCHVQTGKGHEARQSSKSADASDTLRGYKVHVARPTLMPSGIHTMTTYEPEFAPGPATTH